MKSRSHTPTHLFKPSLRLGLRGELGERLEVGGALVGVISASEHYRVLGALGQGRYAAVRTRAFSLGASAGVGLGYDADILHADLSAGAKVAPYWLVSIDGRWAIGTPLPSDVESYATRCLKLNPTPIPPYEGDPHRGWKNVFACDVDRAIVEANQRPFPDGTLIVKESTRPGESAVWLVATARKQHGSWQWDEYTRNFADEDFDRSLAGQGLCRGCHQEARAADWIFTRFALP